MPISALNGCVREESPEGERGRRKRRDEGVEFGTGSATKA